MVRWTAEPMHPGRDGVLRLASRGLLAVALTSAFLASPSQASAPKCEAAAWEKPCEKIIEAVSDDRTTYLYRVRGLTHGACEAPQGGWDSLCVGHRPEACSACSTATCDECENRAVYDARLPALLCMEDLSRLARVIENAGFSGVVVHPEHCASGGELVEVSSEQAALASGGDDRVPLWFSTIPILMGLGLALWLRNERLQKLAMLAMPLIAAGTIAVRVQSDRTRSLVTLPVVQRVQRPGDGISLRRFPADVSLTRPSAQDAAAYRFPVDSVRFSMLGPPRVDVGGVEVAGALENRRDQPVEVLFPTGQGEPFTIHLDGVKQPQLVSDLPASAQNTPVSVLSFTLPGKTGVLFHKRLPFVGREYRPGQTVQVQLVFHYVDGDVKSVIGALQDSWTGVIPRE
jgi:hypothetical protein